MIGPCFPRFIAANSANLELPAMVSGRMGETRGSCATGYDRQTLIRSVGEALERQMSFSRMPRTKLYRRLDELDDRMANWFRILFHSVAQPDLNDHVFACIEVYNVRNDAIVIVPAIPFTLAPHPDARFMPCRDSSGCAIHPDPEHAMQTAIAELAERQGLTLFWYFNHLNHTAEITWQSVDNIRCADAARIARWFLTVPGGRMFLFDISVIKPYRSVLAIYISEDGPVHFAAGGSGSHDVFQAISKALVELYQAYILTYQSLASMRLEQDLAESTDSITQGYLTFNDPDRVHTFIELAKTKINDLSMFCDIAKWTVDQQSIDILAYRQSLSFGHNWRPLTYVSTLCVPGFALMTISDTATDTDLQAAALHGYSCQVRSGAVPFA